MSGVVVLLGLDVQTALGVNNDLATLTGLQNEEATEGELWFRDNDHRDWAPVRGFAHAEHIINTRTDRVPWATIKRTPATPAHGVEEHFALEVLGSPDRMYVSGDVRSSFGWVWFWASWPEGHAALPRQETTVGPRWYRARVWGAQVLTAHDAIAQLRPALHARAGVERQAPGYVWRTRHHDLDLLDDLRTPVVY